ncbi:adenylate/guanylate cyclase domain-containing protein [Leptolyngbya iicbica]|uniref:Adenylate cyclase n=2 Tax=Cyanophyceae TaxID=3028117 RepID=A0A4Q7E7R3_9CYAN|nr:adenylate/guanylate cyclase domain-containing protein [Leptolyngbya sp. LK]RZM78622.1 adenylate cyclase [Leptolyngbya sp. LK]
MGELRSTVIMKTDIRGFTNTVGRLSEAELSTLLSEHKQFILDLVAKQDGQLVKGEGDAFWLTFPSVTDAALAASAIQAELRLEQTGKSDDDRLAVRIVIVLGDVLHQGNDIFGAPVNLAARLESVTPPDEIYLSQAACLALNAAEINTSYVGEFSLKGMTQTTQVYKVNLQHRTRVLPDQVIVISDLTNYNIYAKTHSIQQVEQVLTQHELLHKQVCQKFGGDINMFIGDACIMLFDSVETALAAVDALVSDWQAFQQTHQVSCAMTVGMHKGDIYLFRTYVYGEAFHLASGVQVLASKLTPAASSRTFVSSQVRAEIQDQDWLARLHLVDVPPKLRERFQFLEQFAVYDLIAPT